MTTFINQAHIFLLEKMFQTLSKRFQSDEKIDIFLTPVGPELALKERGVKLSPNFSLPNFPRNQESSVGKLQFEFHIWV